MSVNNSRNTNSLLNQQIALLKQVTSNNNNRTKSMTKNYASNNSNFDQQQQRQQKFYSSQSNPLGQQQQQQYQSNLNNNSSNIHGSQGSIILPTYGSQHNIAQNLQQQLGKQPSYRRDHSNIKRRGQDAMNSNQQIPTRRSENKIFLPQNVISNQTPDLVNVQNLHSGLYQQIRSKNNASALSQSYQNPTQQLINVNNGSTQLQLKEFGTNNSSSVENGNNVTSSGQGRKSALLRYQQQFQSQKRGSSKQGNDSTSNKNSMRNTKTEQFFSTRGGGSNGQNQANNHNASKDNLKQVIKIYKDGIRDENQLHQQNSGVRQSQVKDANLKSNLIGNIRNMSVPRGSQQKSYMLSSQDYASNNFNNPNAYYQNAETQKIPGKMDKIQYQRQQEALNNSVGNIKLSDINNSSYGIDGPLRSDKMNLNETAPLPGQGQNHTTNKHSILQGTLRSCNCPCSCQMMQQETQSQTTHQANNMMSILSGTNRKNHFNINNTMTLKIGQGLHTTTGGHQTTTVMLDDPSNVEATNIEDMHHLMVNVEKIKRKMLGKIEGQNDPNLDYNAFNNFLTEMEQKNKNSKINVNGDFNYLNNSLDDTNANLSVIIFE